MVELEFSVNPRMLKTILVIGFLITVLALELMLTYTHPIVFGDEGFHVANARYIAQNLDYSKHTPLYGSTLYPENYARPPMWNLMEASFYMIFGFSDAIIKFLVPFISFLTGLVIYIFVRKLYSESAAAIAAIIAVTIPSFVTYSVTFYVAVPYMFFFTLGFMSLLTAIKTGSRKFWILAGIFSGVSILVDIAGLFLVALVVAMAVVSAYKNRSRHGLMHALKTYGLVLLIAALVVSPLFARNFALYHTAGCNNPLTIFQGNCPTPVNYQQQTSSQFAGRNAGGGTEGSILDTGIANYVQFAYGFSNPSAALNFIGFVFVPISFLAGMIIIGKRREHVDIAMIVSAIIFVILFAQIGGLTQGRAEDTARYFLSATPLIAIACAVLFANLKMDGKKFNNVLVSLVFVVVILLAFINLHDKLTIMSSVKNFVPSFFQACTWIDQNLPKNANLLSLQTYPTRYNCDRAAVWEIPDKADILLSNNVTAVKDRLDANGIGYIFVQKFSLSNTPVEQAYPVSFVNFLESNNQTFERMYENGPAYGTQDFVNCVNSGTCDPGNIVFRVK